MYRLGAPMKRGPLLIGERDIDHFEEAALAEPAGHAGEQPVDAVLALEMHGARQHLAGIEHDRVDHLRDRGARRVEGAARLEQVYDFGTAVASALHDALEALGGDEVRGRNAGA